MKWLQLCLPCLLFCMTSCDDNENKAALEALKQKCTPAVRQAATTGAMQIIGKCPQVGLFKNMETFKNDTDDEFILGEATIYTALATSVYFELYCGGPILYDEIASGTVKECLKEDLTNATAIALWGLPATDFDNSNSCDENWSYECLDKASACQHSKAKAIGGRERVSADIYFLTQVAIHAKKLEALFLSDTYSPASFTKIKEEFAAAMSKIRIGYRCVKDQEALSETDIDQEPEERTKKATERILAAMDEAKEVYEKVYTDAGLPSPQKGPDAAP